MAEWTQDGPFRDAMRSVWRGYPRTGAQDQAGEGEDAQAVGRATCLKDSTQPCHPLTVQPPSTGLLAAM